MATFKLKWRGPEAVKAIRRTLRSDYARMANLIDAAVKEECPVRSGDLRRSSFAILEPSTIRIIVGATEDYAGFVFRGTTRHPEPNPWLQRGVDRVTSTFRFSTLTG